MFLRVSTVINVSAIKMAGVATNEHIQGKAKDPKTFDTSITEVRNSTLLVVKPFRTVFYVSIDSIR